MEFIHRIAGLQLPGVDADEGQLADKRVSHDLECQRRKTARCQPACASMASSGLSGLMPCVSRHIQRRRQIIHHRIQQRLHAFVLEGRAATAPGTTFRAMVDLAQRSAQFVGGNGLRLRETCAAFRRRFRRRSRPAARGSFGFLLQFGGNFFVLRTSAPMVSSRQTIAFMSIRSTTPLKLVFLSDGNLNRDGLGVEALADGIDGVLEIGAHLVNLVDKANSRERRIYRPGARLFPTAAARHARRQTQRLRHQARAASARLQR